MTPARLRWGGHAATGPTRSLNEDAFRAVLLPDWGGIFAVFDGAGGMVSAAEHASLALDTVVHALRTTPDADRLSEHALRGALSEAGAVLRVQNARWQTPGSGGTTAVAVVHGGQAWLAWIGDCRVWRLDASGALSVLTREHSLTAMLVEAGKMTPEEAKTSPYRHVVTRALMGGDDAEQERPDARAVSLEPGDTLVLATDGCWRSLDDAALIAALEGRSAQHAAETLVERAHAVDGGDNAAAVVVRL